MQILSPAPPGTQPLDMADAVPLAKRANDIAAEAVRLHPTRFRAFATLLRHALEVTTPDRLLFSTDYPFQRPSKADIDRFGTAFPTEEDRDRFMAGNARALFAITS